MKKQRRKLTDEFKAQVAMEALKGLDTVNQIASKYEVHPTQVSQWKRELADGAKSVFKNKPSKADAAKDQEIETLERKVGQLTMEVDWLEKKCVMLGLIPKGGSK